MEKFSDRQIEIMEAATARIDTYGIQNLTIKNLAADIGLSEPALYRHFKSKNDILLGLLNYFITGMKNRLNNIPINPDATAADELRSIFNSQLQTFTNKPAIVSVIFAESIFHYDEGLSYKVSEIMDLIHQYVNKNIEKGQKGGTYNKLIGASTLTTIILGGMRMTVLKWKLSGHKSNLIKDGTAVLEGILKMIEKK
ncbi:TetR/AcrR family transcriptional regulator [Myroides odoratus]